MPRAKDAPTRVGGEISPYVQTSLQRGKQQAESRLVAAMQEAGAAGRTAMTERGATERAGIQAATQRGIAASRLASEDRRAAESEIARRDDQKFTTTMEKIKGELRAKEGELDRAMHLAIAKDNREDKKEIAERQLSFDKFRATLAEKAQIRDTNLMVSILKGTRNREDDKEKRKTTMYGQSDKFEDDKEIYELAKESISESILNDKRMDLPARKPRPAFRGAPIGITYPAPAEPIENVADPMGVLQDLITKEEGRISVENLSSANIHKIEEQIINEEVKTEDINRVFGAMDAMLEAVAEKRLSVDKKSDEFDFWNDQHINMSQFKRNLTKLEDSTKKIKGSETQTVGKEIIYALRTIRREYLGNRVSRYRAEFGDENFDALEDELSGPREPYEPMEITPDMNKYEIENWNWYNNTILPLYEQTEMGGIE